MCHLLRSHQQPVVEKGLGALLNLARALGEAPEGGGAGPSARRRAELYREAPAETRGQLWRRLEEDEMGKSAARVLWHARRTDAQNPVAEEIVSLLWSKRASPSARERHAATVCQRYWRGRQARTAAAANFAVKQMGRNSTHRVRRVLGQKVPSLLESSQLVSPRSRDGSLGSPRSPRSARSARSGTVSAQHASPRHDATPRSARSATLRMK